MWLYVTISLDRLLIHRINLVYSAPRWLSIVATIFMSATVVVAASVASLSSNIVPELNPLRIPAVIPKWSLETAVI